MPEISVEKLAEIRSRLEMIRNGAGSQRPKDLANEALAFLPGVATAATPKPAVLAGGNVDANAAEKGGAEGKELAAEHADFATSLVGIGASVVKAQQELDSASLEYCRAGRRDAMVVPPTLYRIPKVTASLKFALESIKGRDVNLLFYKNTSEQKELHQQTLELDIVAVPPPPEFVDYLALQLPNVRLVLGLAERANLTPLLEGWAAVVPGRGEELLRHVVLLELPLLTGQRPVRPYLALLAFPASSTAQYVAAARLVPGTSEPYTVLQPKAIDPSETGMEANLRGLIFDIVGQWAEAQNELPSAAPRARRV